MLFQMTQICFNEPDNVTLHYIINIMTEKGAKMTHKRPEYWFYANYVWHLSEKCYYEHTMTDFVVWLSYYVPIFAI